ncbi:MAG: response regulator transcription factor [Bacteroidota bacterium]
MAEKNAVSNGISTLLNNEQEFNVVGKVKTYPELTEVVSAARVDVLIVDGELFEVAGLDLIEQIRSRADVKIILLFDPQVTDFRECFKLPIEGFIGKGSTFEELGFAIDQVFNGNRFVSTSIVLPYLDNEIQQPRIFDTIETALLSDREKEILVLMANGFTNQEIADKIFTSKRTVEGHRQSLISKTGSRNTASLIRYAMYNGLIEPE